MADPSMLPAFVQAQLPTQCMYCGRDITPLDFTFDLEEMTKGENLFLTVTVEFYCVPECGTRTLRRYVDWQRTEYP